MSKDNERDAPISSMVAQRGIKTSADFADFMAALMADLVDGTIDPETARAACIAGDRLLQVAKMQLDFEYSRGDRGKVLRLTGTTITKPELATSTDAKGRDPVDTISGDGL